MGRRDSSLVRKLLYIAAGSAAYAAVNLLTEHLSFSRPRSGAAGYRHPRPLWRPVRADRWLPCRIPRQHGLRPAYVWLLLELVAGQRIAGDCGGPHDVTGPSRSQAIA